MELLLRFCYFSIFISKSNLHSNMELLLPHLCHDNQQLLQYLHSNMELLLHLNQDNLLHNILHLHSNMELLLLYLSVIILTIVSNLHSNMELLLPENEYTPLAYSNEFTFQYGATSTRDCYKIHRRTVNIYIPIWSYFYRIFLFFLYFNFCIYIPIWSYFYLLF